MTVITLKAVPTADACSGKTSVVHMRIKIPPFPVVALISVFFNSEFHGTVPTAFPKWLG